MVVVNPYEDLLGNDEEIGVGWDFHQAFCARIVTTPVALSTTAAHRVTRAKLVVIVIHRFNVLYTGAVACSSVLQYCRIYLNEYHDALR